MTDILATASGTEALCNIFRMVPGRVFLPSDICSTVLEGCERREIVPSFYAVQRGWAVSADRYVLPPVDPGDLIVVSDLFNFRSIDLRALTDRKVVLDLAHCSFATASEYLADVLAEKIDVDIVALVFSFGRGKYVRRGGGGCLVGGLTGAAPLDAARALFQLEREFGPSPQYSACDLRGYFVSEEVRVNAHSTRMVIRPTNIGSGREKIEELRRMWRLDISDGLYNHIERQHAPEFYVWKRISS